MVHRIEGRIHVDNEMPEGDEEIIEVTLKWRPAHYATPEQVGERVKEFRRKLARFYEKLAYEHDD